MGRFWRPGDRLWTALILLLYKTWGCYNKFDSTKLFGVYYWCAKTPQFGYMERGVEYITFYVQNTLAPLAMCYQPLLVRDQALGPPAFVKLVYTNKSKRIRNIQYETWSNYIKIKHNKTMYIFYGIFCVWFISLRDVCMEPKCQRGRLTLSALMASAERHYSQADAISLMTLYMVACTALWVKGLGVRENVCACVMWCVCVCVGGRGGGGSSER